MKLQETRGAGVHAPTFGVSDIGAAARRGVAGKGRSAGEMLIATINRPEGDTGIHAHTRSLMAGMNAAEVHCEAITPFSRNPAWLALFAVRPLLLEPLNKTWSTRWHRHFHGLALERKLRARLGSNLPTAIIAQCPVSAQAALNVRRELAFDAPIIAVCHFNFSEATEYRDRGELADQAAFKEMLDMEADVLSRVDKVIYVSEWARNVVEKERGIATRSSAVVWNGIPNQPPTAALDRQSLGFTADDLLLLNVGSLEPRKNQIALLDLFAITAQHFPAAKLLLVGDGPDRAAIKEKIAALGLGERVKCLGFRTDVPALLATADLYLHYARLENCPVVLLEAARAGLASASVPAGGAAEIFKALRAGVLLHPDDAEKGADRLAPLLADGEMRRKMGRRARRGFLARFTQEAMVRSYIEQLHSIGADVVAAEAP